MRLPGVLLLLLALPICAAYAGGQQHSYRPKRGFVPDPATACSIAEAVLIPIYGRVTVRREKPFKATLHGDTWVVVGTLREHHRGGAARVELSRLDARILRVTHGR
jgi:hypothetical protein